MRGLTLLALCCTSPTDKPVVVPDRPDIALADANPDTNEDLDEEDSSTPTPMMMPVEVTGTDTAVPVPAPTPRASPSRPCIGCEQSPVDLLNLALYEQAQKVKATRYDLQALEFYLVDKRAHKDGQITVAWKQPPLDLYKVEPWCHAPVPHGEHTPPPPKSPPSPAGKLDLSIRPE